MKFPTYNERLQKVKAFANANKIFVAISIIVVILLIGNFFSSDKTSDDSSIPTNETSQSSEVIEETEVAEMTEAESQTLQFRFYWIDLWILVIAGGFCAIMIIRERKKAKEELQ